MQYPKSSLRAVKFLVVASIIVSAVAESAIGQEHAMPTSNSGTEVAGALASKTEEYGPPIPVGYTPPVEPQVASPVVAKEQSLSQKATQLWSRFKDTLFGSLPSPAPKIATTTVAQPEKLLSSQPNATSTSSTTSLTDSKHVTSQTRLVPTIMQQAYSKVSEIFSRSNTLIEVKTPNHTLKTRRDVLKLAALPELQAIPTRTRVGEIAAVKEAVLPPVVAKNSITLLPTLSLEKLHLVPSEAITLSFALAHWILLPEENANEAVQSIFKIASTGNDKETKAKAQAFLGWILEQKKLPSLAALSFAHSLSTPHRHIDAVLSAMGSLSRETILAKTAVPNNFAATGITKTMKNLDGVGFAILTSAENEYAKHAYQKARKIALTVPEKSAWRENARYLAAISVFADSEKKESLELAGKELTDLFKTVDDSQVFDATAVSLGRIHFLLGNYKAAHQYLSQVSRDTNMFIEAAIDNSWSLLRSGDRNQAVGNMFTLNTGYFEGAYKPDSFFIQSLGYQEVCQFGDAMTAVRVFKSRYHTLFKKLSEFNVNGKKSDLAYYEDLINMLSKKEHLLPEVVLRELGRHPEFLKRQKATNMMIKEEKLAAEKLPVIGTQLGAWLKPEMTAIQSNYKKEAVTFLKQKALSLEEDLKFLTANIALLEYEIFTSASTNIALQGAQNFDIDEKKAISEAKVEENKEYWPYEDEIWEDELNNFRSKMVDACAKLKKNS